MQFLQRREKKIFSRYDLFLRKLADRGMCLGSYTFESKVFAQRKYPSPSCFLFGKSCSASVFSFEKRTPRNVYEPTEKETAIFKREENREYHLFIRGKNICNLDLCWKICGRVKKWRLGANDEIERNREKMELGNDEYARGFFFECDWDHCLKATRTRWKDCLEYYRGFNSSARLARMEAFSKSRKVPGISRAL